MRSVTYEPHPDKLPDELYLAEPETQNNTNTAQLLIHSAARHSVF